MHVRRPSSHSRPTQRGWRRGHTTKGDQGQPRDTTKPSRRLGAEASCRTRAHESADKRRTGTAIMETNIDTLPFAWIRPAHHSSHATPSLTRALQRLGVRYQQPSKQATPPGDTVIRHDSKKELDQPSANCTTHDSTIGQACTRPRGTVLKHVGWM